MLLKIYPDPEMTLELFPAVLCGCAAEFLARVLWEATGRVHCMRCLCCGAVVSVLSGNLGGWLGPQGFIP